MNKVPGAVVLACTLCVGCLVYAALLELKGIPALVVVAQLLAILGLLGVANETFRWGAKEGYTLTGQRLSVQIEHALRCLAMTVMVLIPTCLIAGLLIETLFHRPSS